MTGVGEIYIMSDNILVEKTEQFAVRMVKLSQHLWDKKQPVIAKQILRSGTSIGANTAKEARETLYWLKLLIKTDYIDKNMYESLYKDLDQILAILTSSIKTTEKHTA